MHTKKTLVTSSPPHPLPQRGSQPRACPPPEPARERRVRMPCCRLHMKMSAPAIDKWTPSPLAMALMTLNREMQRHRVAQTLDRGTSPVDDLPPFSPRVPTPPSKNQHCRKTSPAHCQGAALVLWPSPPSVGARPSREACKPLQCSPAHMALMPRGLGLVQGSCNNVLRWGSPETALPPSSQPA